MRESPPRARDPRKSGVRLHQIGPRWPKARPAQLVPATKLFFGFARFSVQEFLTDTCLQTCQSVQWQSHCTCTGCQTPVSSRSISWDIWLKFSTETPYVMALGSSEFRAVKGLPLLTAQVDLHSPTLYRETLWHSKSKERLAKPCALRHVAYHLGTRLLSKLFYWIIIYKLFFLWEVPDVALYHGAFCLL
jgi:hypothetical protein